MTTLIASLTEAYAEAENTIEELEGADAGQITACGQNLNELSLRIEHIADVLRKLLAHVHNAAHAASAAADIIEQADWNSGEDPEADSPTDEFREYLHIYAAKTADELERAVEGTKNLQ